MRRPRTRQAFGQAAVLVVTLVLLQTAGAHAWTGTQSKQSTKETDAAKAFDAGNKLMEKEAYTEALVEYRKGLALEPDAYGLLWNGGMSAYFAKDYPFALTLMKRLKARDLMDDAVRCKLIQIYRASGDTKSLAQERAELVKLRKSGGNPKLAARPSFCCDQFSAGGRKVFAYDFFELEGDRALRYNFLILKPDGTADYRVSLGSYKDTNAIAQQLGEVKPGHRLYHLDGYYEQAHKHETYRFYQAEPPYDTVKKDVIAVVQQTLKAQSSSTRP